MYDSESLLFAPIFWFKKTCVLLSHSQQVTNRRAVTKHLGVHQVMEIVQDIYQKERWVFFHLETKPADQLSNEKKHGLFRGFVGDPERDYNKPIQTINFTSFGEDGWKTILSFWGLRPIFSCELLISGRSPL